ncbi:helix-turn-helix domain-containing protein [Streptomyces sp. NPDC058239]|uniref:helix-turn-helix domain-containing protein n=1 Tax=Streptomyces sp. NPDC058239 TaxID=3346395 RepID=UPI0036F156C9
MPVALARPIVLTNAERERLKKAAYGHKTAYQARQRAAIVLHAARGRPNAHIARETGLHLDTVRTWRNRFADGRLPALADRRRSGRPARFTPPCRSPRPRPWPASSRPRPGSRCRAGRARSWPPS